MNERSTRADINRIALPCILTCVIIFRIVVLLSFPLTEDGEMYHQAGSDVAAQLTAGSPIDLESYPQAVAGVRTYALITGAFYYAFGHSYVLIRAFNSLLGGLGTLLFYSVVMRHYPSASLVSRCMIFLDPTTVLWTSIHGKDPIIFFLLAVAFWSLSRVLSGARGYLILYAASLGAMATIRVHVALILSIAASLSLIRFRRTVRNRAVQGFLALSFVLFVLMLLRFATMYIRELSYEFIVAEIGETLTGLSTGGSAISIPRISTVSDLLAYWPRGIVGVLFRPFPWDSGTLSLHLAAAVQALVSGAVVVIMLRFWKRGLKPDPLRSFMLYYGILFAALFALIVGNLGTLVREKAQLVPFIWCLLAATDPLLSVRRSTLVAPPKEDH